jgi:ABC transporter/Amino acid permease
MGAKPIRAFNAGTEQLQLAIEGVSKRFGGVTAVENVTVTVRHGEILSVIGPNGAGKTSLLNMISGFYRPTNGAIYLEGRDITRLRPSQVAALGVARTFQNIALFAGMTVLDNIMLGRHVHMRSGVFASLIYWGQISILIVQGVIVTVLALAYFVMADVSVAFFLLSAVTITLYLIMYMPMYAAAIRLRYTQPDLKRSYRVPGGMVGMWCIAGVGFAGVAFSFLVGFFPPTQLPVGSPAVYLWLVIGGTVVFTGLPLLLGMLKQSSWRAVAHPAVAAE